MVFVVFEGLDASGKSTQAEYLQTLLQHLGKVVLSRTHPSEDNLVGRLTKHFLRLTGRSAHFASALFYLLDVIRSILLFSWRDTEFIIFIRYLMGTAYLPSPADVIGYNIFARLIPKPDYVFYLDITPEIAHQRILTTRIDTEAFETLEKLVKIRKKALRLANIGHWLVIDGTQSVQEIQTKIQGYLSLIPKAT